METTIVPASPEAPEGSPPPAPRGARERVAAIPRGWLLGAIALVIAGILLAAAVVQLPYYALEPGLVRPTNDLIVVEGVELPDPPEGSISYTCGSSR
jgi:hypothetical protein